MGSVFEGLSDGSSLVAWPSTSSMQRRPGTKRCSSASNAKRRQRVASGCDHILEVLDLGTLPDGDRYMVMEYLDGEELSARIERMGAILAAPVGVAHPANIGRPAGRPRGRDRNHRDLKPDNIFILREKAGHPDYVKIIDFGISKFNALSGDMSMTTTGAVMGTPFYMSPEQAKAEAAGVDARTDLYVIGVIMYEALTGRVPFEGTSFNDLMFKIVLGFAPPSFRRACQTTSASSCRRRWPAILHSAFNLPMKFLRAIDGWLSANGFGGSRVVAEHRAGGVGRDDGTRCRPGRTAHAPPDGNTTKTAGAWARHQR